MTKLSVDGVDISKFQTYKIDYKAAMSMGVKFLYHKVTEGVTINHDESYQARRRECNKAGMPFGAYHFARPTIKAGDAIAEAQYFLSHARFLPGDLVPMLDLEDTGGLSRAQLTRWALTWMMTVEWATKCKPLVYTNFDLDSDLGAYLWQARYNDKNIPPKQAEPWKQIDIHQFSNGFQGNPSRIDPFPGPTDLNHIASTMKVKDITSKVAGTEPDGDKFTGAFRITTQNVQALPLMDQGEVVHDIQLTAAESGIIGWQELMPERYDLALHALERSGVWETYWGQGGVNKKPVNEDQGENEWYSTPISWRTKFWTFVDGGKWVQHKGKKGITGTRWVTWVLLRHNRTGAETLIVNLHTVAGAWNGKFAKTNEATRQKMWREGYAKLKDWLEQAIVEFPNAAIAITGDYNARWDRDKEEFQPLRVGGRKITMTFPTAIDHILLINGKKYKWKVEDKELLPGRHSDHQGRRVYARLTWAA